MSYAFREPLAPLNTNLPPWQARLLACRGAGEALDAELPITRLLHWQGLRGVRETAQRIVIVGDYDADGATATAVMVLGLRMLGAQSVDFVVPDRIKHGYGLSRAVVDMAQNLAPGLIITVDNGISAHDAIDYARSCAIDVVVTDHHLAGETLPPTDWIVNPNRPECGFEAKYTAGVGVAFYVLLAARAALRSDAPLQDLLDLVALGTVADVVPMRTNNRILVRYGLARIRRGMCRPLIKALFEVSGRGHPWASAADLGYAIAPRINAAGRIDDMALGIRGLLEDDEGRAREIAAALHEINEQRRAVQQEMELDARALLPQDIEGRSSLVVFLPDGHKGVIGLVASRLKEQAWRPTIVLCPSAKEGILKGSGRSIAGLHLRDALIEVRQQLPEQAMPTFGGHAMAAGLTLRMQDLEAFKAVFEHVCKQHLQPHQLTRTLLLDTPPDDADLTLQAAHWIEQYPWGAGFEEPIFGSTLNIVEQQTLKDKHLKLTVRLRDGRMARGILFGRPEPLPQDALLAWRPTVNRYNGREYLDIRVEQVLSR